LGTASSGPARSVAMRLAWARHGRARKTTTLATGAAAPSTVRGGIRSWCGWSWRVSFGSGMAGYGGICHGGVRKGSSMCGGMRNHSRDRRGCTFDGAEWDGLRPGSLRRVGVCWGKVEQGSLAHVSAGRVLSCPVRSWNQARAGTVLDQRQRLGMYQDELS
jgi:hypothetical protein